MNFLKRLRLDQPQSGRRVKENGDAFNEADHFQQERWASTQLASESGELFRIFDGGELAIAEKRCVNPDRSRRRRSVRLDRAACVHSRERWRCSNEFHS